MRNVALIMRRELRGYFATPLAYIFIVIFLALAGALTFFLGGLLQRGQADLQRFFSFHPWLYLFLLQALSMRLWADERRPGTIALFLTLPLSMGEEVIAKSGSEERRVAKQCVSPCISRGSHNTNTKIL